MRRMRINDMPEDGTYVSRARQAIEDENSANDEDGDKQAGDGLIEVPLQGLHKALDIVHELKENNSINGQDTGEIDKLEKALESIIKE